MTALHAIVRCRFIVVVVGGRHDTLEAEKTRTQGDECVRTITRSAHTACNVLLLSQQFGVSKKQFCI